VVELLAPYKDISLLSDKDKFNLRFNPSLAELRTALQSGKFSKLHVSQLDRKLRNILSTTTRHRLTTESGLVLDGPVGASAGQAGVELLHALDGSQVRCVKLGGIKLMSEYKVSLAIHNLVHCPSLLRIFSFQQIKLGVIALVMPLYPMSIADVMMTLPPGPSTARDNISHSVALQGLCSVAAFALANFAHGDIKPSNFMLDNNGHVILIDFGTAKSLGDSFTESSHYSLNQVRTATTEYDLVCLGATLASLQHDLGVDQWSSRSSVLASLQAVEGKRSPASLLAEACLMPDATIVKVKMIVETLFTDELSLLWPRLIAGGDAGVDRLTT